MPKVYEADAEFRDEARTWIEANKPAGARPADPVDARPYDLAWQRTQYDAGWAGLNWPTEVGGRDLSLAHQLVWYEEITKADAPSAGVCFVGLNHAGPTLILNGSPQQQAHYLPAILRGEMVWCQGFSEPGAGSDLASLRTTAVVDGDDLVVNGQKIWTSYAHVADVQELLIRTDASVPKHRGLTWVINDMGNRGMEVRPIRNITGVQDFCEVFYDDVHIPMSRVVGGLNNGWSVAMSTLAFERGTAFIVDILRLVQTVEELITEAKVRSDWSGRTTAWQDDSVRVLLATVRAEASALRALNLAVVSSIQRTGQPGPEASIVRYYYGQLSQRVHEVALVVLGADALSAQPRDRRWSSGYLNSFRNVIAGGTKDIQRNIIAERMLGLPKAR